MLSQVRRADGWSDRSRNIFIRSIPNVPVIGRSNVTASAMFRIIYVVGIISMFIIRLLIRGRHKNTRIAERRFIGLEVFLLVLAFLGVIAVPLVYVFSDALNFADYQLPAWAGWMGAFVFLAGLWLLWSSHSDLGQNWSQTLELREGHELITNGVYRKIRHPMYGAVWLCVVAQALLLHSWVAGFTGLVSFTTLYFLRVPREERMMLDHFGEEYQSYMSRTGRVIPRWREC
jgi:protein-S-isoprenylcysteine O-methyltransferase Ste14